MTTCCSVFGLVLLVLTNLAAIISFATPFWIAYNTGKNQGLWAVCQKDSCTWVFEDSYTRASLVTVDVKSAWWIAIQGLTCFGLALSLFSMLLATIALCCDCKGCNASHAIAGLLVLAFLSLGVAAVVFGVCTNEHHGVELEWSRESTRRLGWSFWLDCGAGGLALITSFIYIIEGRGKYA